MRTLIKMAIVGLVLHAVFRVGTSYLTYYTFRDELQQIAQFGTGRSAAELKTRSMEIAQQMKVPLAADRLKVRIERDHTYIDASYRTSIEILPKYFHPWDYQINIDAWTLSVREASLSR